MMNAEGSVSGGAYDAVPSEQISRDAARRQGYGQPPQQVACGGCGTLCGIDATFCNTCGTPVPPQQQQQQQQQQQFFQQQQQVCAAFQAKLGVFLEGEAVSEALFLVTVTGPL